VDHFVDLHEGLPPQALTCEAYEGPVGRVKNLGRITAIEYRKQTLKGLETYWHPFAPHAQPRVGLDQRGKPVIWAGRYRVRTGGITDRGARSVEPEFIPRNPQSLSDLGILQWIRYDSGNGEQTLRFSAREMLAHDEHGHLYIQTGRPVSDAVNSIHEGNMRKKIAKRNPVKFQNRSGTAQRELIDVITGVAFVGAAALGVTELSARFLPATLTGYKRAGTQLAAGLGLAAAASRFPIVPDEITLGLGVAGVVAGGATAIRQWQTQREINALKERTGSPAPGTGVAGGTSGAGYASLGAGGMPPGYYGINRAGCAVGYR
jgi:hypothetical protein